MTKYIPETGQFTVPEVVKPKTVIGIKNRLPVGTPIRATLGATVIVGEVGKQETHHAIVYVDIKPRNKKAYSGLLEGHALWVDDGWEFEILDDAKATS